MEIKNKLLEITDIEEFKSLGFKYYDDNFCRIYYKPYINIYFGFDSNSIAKIIIYYPNENERAIFYELNNTILLFKLITIQHIFNIE